MLERLFHISEKGSSVKTEVIAGITTFMTMSYIIFVQPAMLSIAGMDFDAVMVATCLASAIGCFLMGLLANYPIALAPAMGHNAYFVFIACPLIAGIIGKTTHIQPWQVALGAVFISGILFFLFSFIGLREKIISIVPLSLQNGIAVGIGLLITLIGFEWSGLTVPDPSTYIKFGGLDNPAVLLSLFGLIIIFVLSALNFKGAILVGILLTACMGLPLGLVEYHGLTDKIPSLLPTFMKLNIESALRFGFLEVIFVFFFLDLFDTVGTLIGIGQKGGFIKDGKLPQAKYAFLSDALATLSGSILGTSTVTSYIESAAGVSAGGRTGFASIVTGILMLVALFFKPLVGMIGKGYVMSDGVRLYPVIAPALIVVGFMMISCVTKIKWDDYTESIPAFLTIVVMPFCGFSITEGIAFGFISYSLLKLVTGRIKDVHWLLYLFSILFILRYIFLFNQ